MTIHVENPGRIIGSEITKWAGQNPQQEKILEHTKQIVALVGDGFVMDRLKKRIDGRRSLSIDEVGEAATELQAILEMRPVLEPAQTTPESVGIEFSAILAKKTDFLKDEEAKNSFQKVAEAVEQLSVVRR